MVPKLTSRKLSSVSVGVLFTVVVILPLYFAPIVSSRSAKLEHDLNQHFLAYEFLQLDPEIVFQQVQKTGQLSLATSDLKFDLELLPHDLRAPGYRAEVFGANDVAQTIDVGPVHTFKGRARGSANGIQLAQLGHARFTINENGIQGLIITPTQHYFVEPASKFSKAALTSEYVIYRESDVVTSSSGDCGVTLSEQVNEKATELSASSTGDALQASAAALQELRIATEADNEYVVSKDNSAAEADREILSILNKVEGLYEVELGLTFRVVYQSAWSTVGDPFGSTNPSELLGELTNFWNSNRGSVARDVVHMWTGKQLDNSTIGTAYLEALCRFAGNGRAAYGLSKGVATETQQVAITAHEIGHNLGATHPNQQVVPITECSNTVMGSSVDTEPQLTFCQFSRDEIATYLSASTSCLSAGMSQVTFAAGREFGAGLSLGQAESADFNGDGKDDLAGLSGVGFRILFGADENPFSNVAEYSLNDNPSSFNIDDVNGDGKDDVITANPFSNSVSILLGTGGGTFLPVHNYPVALKPSVVTTGDFNGDGNKDLAFLHIPEFVAENASQVSILFGAGDGSFPTASGIYPAGRSPISLAVGDFNGDARHDLIVAHYSELNLSVFLGTDTGFMPALKQSMDVATPALMAVGDVNADGHQDLVTGSAFTDTISVFLGTGSGNFVETVTYPVGGISRDLLLADLNGDSALDIAVTSVSFGYVSVFLGNGTGSFLTTVNYPVGNSPGAMVMGDFNGDGKQDFTTANFTSHSLLLGNGDGTFEAANLYSTTDYARSVAIGDFNNDGNLDLAAALSPGPVPGSVAILLGTNSGKFLPAVNYPVGTDPFSVAVGDFNSDNKQDLVVANSGCPEGFCSSPGRGVSVLLGTGSGTFNPATNYTVGGSPFSVAVGDLNADGKNDIVTANLSNTLGVLLGTGLGDFHAAVTYEAGSVPNSIVIGDLTGDGNQDLVTTTSPNFVTILPGTGSGTFLSPVNYVVDISLESVAVGDFNADGKPDLATTIGAVLSPGSVDVLLSNGMGGFLPPVRYPVGGVSPGSLAVSDFNSDGKQDIVTTNSSSGSVSILLGTGTGSFLTSVDFAGGSRPTSAAAGDFNGDGKQDLALANGQIAVLLNTSGHSLSGPVNDHFSAARVISGPNGSISGSTVLATKEPGEVDHAGGPDGTIGASIWYRWTAPTSRKFYFQTFSSSFPSVLAVYTGTSLASLTNVVRSTNTVPEYVELNATAGTTYQIAIDGVTGDSGRTVLNWNTGSLSNDNFSFSREIRGSRGSLEGDNTNFTLEPNEPTLPGASGTGFSAWYRWTAPNTGKVSFAAAPCGDTTRLLGAYTGNFLDILSPVAVNFDGYRDFDDPGGCDNRSLRFNAVAGTTYRIQLRSATGAPFKLEWNYANPPPNDNFANALVLAGSSGSLLGANRDATKEPGEPNHAGGPGGASIWYRWTAPTSGQVTFDTFGFRNQTSNSFRYLTALMAVYTGTSLDNLTSVVTNATDNKVTFNATSGTTYHIAIDSGPYAGGGYLPGIVPLHWGAKQVANDDFIHAQPLTVASTFTPVLGSNSGATKETGEPSHAGGAGGTSVWYRWTALSSDEVSFVLRPCITCTLSLTNALVGIYTGASVNTLTAVPATLDNNHMFSAVRGRTYFFAVDSGTAASGTFEFSLVSSNISARNNDFSRAQVLSGNNGVVAGDNSGATEEPSEPDHANDRGGASVWYQWKAPASGLYTFDTFGSNFDTLLGVYTGNVVSALTVVASSDNAGSSQQSRITFDAKLNTTYFIAVDGKSTGVELGSGLPHSQAGFILLNWNNLPPPPNDNLANAQLINGTSGNVSGRNTVASKEGGEPNHVGGPGGASVWYQWTAPNSGNFTFNTFGSDFNTLLGVYRGTGVNSLTAVSSNDDVGGVTQSRVTFNAVAGTVYYIAVDGSPGVPGNVTAFSGNVMLSWFPETGVSNDNFLSAQPLNGSSGSLAATNAGATKESGEPNHANDRGGRSVWYSWIAPVSGPVLFTSAGSDFDTLLAIYTGTNANQLTAVTSNDDSPYTDNLGHILTSSLTFTAVAGTTYRIAVDGSGGRFGNFALRWGPDAKISGQVSFIGGVCGSDKKVTMLLSGEDTRAVTFTSSGTYTFEHLRVGGNYSVRGVSEISANCLPLFLERARNSFPLAGEVLDANFVDDGLRGGGSTSNITGHVQTAGGVGLHNIAIALSGTASRTVYTDNAGLYLLPNLPAGTYQVTPSKAGVVFTPGTRQFTFTSGQTILDADFATQDSFTISGQTREQNNVPLSGVTITLNNGSQPVSVQSDANGYYSFDATAGSYTLTAAKAGLSFTPASTSITGLNANQKNVDFTVTQTHILTVASVNPSNGVNITVSANDNNSQGSGSTQFTRTYNLNANVTLTAPATAGSNTFQKWQKDGVDFSTNLSATVTMDGNHTMTAVYATPTRTLTVASSNPASGVNMTVTPNDNASQGTGTTQFTRTYNLNTSVSLTAPATVGDNNFQKWQKDGADFSTNLSANVTMDGNHTMTAVYATPTRTLIVASSNPASGVNMTVTPNDNASQGNGTTQFTRTYNLNQTVNLTASAATSGNIFQKWLKDGVDHSTSVSTTVMMDANHTMTAVYLTTATQTPAGQNVSVQLNGVKVSFATVMAPGTTTIMPISPPTAGPLPNGFQLTGNSIAFEVSTTAVVQPPISVCFNVPSVTDVTVFGQLRILHNENGTLVDRTSSQDFSAKLVCATVSSLSPFVLASTTVQQLELLLEESALPIMQATTVDAVLLLRDPFPVVNPANVFLGGDKNTRVLVFVRNLQLLAGETAEGAIVVRLIDAQGQSHNIAAEKLFALPGFDFSQLTFRLPDTLAAGTCTIEVKAHGQVSNLGTMRIK